MAQRVFYLILFILYCEVISDEVKEIRWRTIEDTAIEIPTEDYCKNKTCLTKCCPKDQVMIKQGLCHLPNNTSEFNGIKKISDVVKILTSNSNVVHWVRDVKLTESEYIFPLAENWTIYKNLSLKLIDVKDEYQWFNYCVDMFLYRNTTTVACKILPYVDLEAHDKIIFNIIGRATSSFFILLVLLVYCLLPSLRNMGGLLLMAHLLSLLIGYIMLLFRDLNLSIWAFDEGPEFCPRTSAAFYFFILASFFWLNIMSFDIWYFTKGYKRVSNPVNIEKPQINYCKLSLYALYAWGVPALLTTILVGIHEHDNGLDKYKHPFESCFSNLDEMRLLLHLPIGIMTAINLIFFSMTAYNIWKTKRSVSNDKNSNSTKKSKNRFILNIKLFIIMGISWILEQVPLDSGAVSAATYMLINFCNVFIGVFIFIFYVCKKSVYYKLRKRFTYRDAPNNRSTRYSRTETTNTT